MIFSLKTNFTLAFTILFTYGTIYLFSSASGQSSRGELRSYEEAAQIYSTISRKYDPRVRPPSNHSESVLVSADIGLKFIYSFDIQQQILHSLVSLNLSWSDRRLAWYPNNILKVIVNQDLIWVPKISFFNGLSLPQEIGEESIHLESKGNVCWCRRLLIKTYCPTDVGKQPNTCFLNLGSISYHSSEQKLRLKSFSLDNSLKNDHFWKILINKNQTGVFENGGLIRCAIDLSPLKTNYPAYSMLRSSSFSLSSSMFIRTVLICSALNYLMVKILF